MFFIFSVTVDAQQWVSFTVHPQRVILLVDGERHVLTDGYTELLLPLGNHSFSVESPYFETLADTFGLTEDGRRDIFVVLQSCYGYLRLQSPGVKDRIFIDQHEIGRHFVQSIRYNAGLHRLTVISDTMCLCDIGIYVNAGEKSAIDISTLGIMPFPWDPARWLVPVTEIGSDGELKDSTAMEIVHAAMVPDSASVNVTSNVDGAEIIIDNRSLGTTPQVVTKLIANRKYMITLRKPGYKTVSRTVTVTADGLTEAYLKMKKH